MKNNNLSKKVFIGMGIFALAIGINMAVGLFQASAQTTGYGSNNGNYYGMMGNIQNSDQFYQDMTALIQKYNINPANHPMMFGNYQGANSQTINQGDYEGSGYGMMGGYRGGRGGMMNW